MSPDRQRTACYSAGVFKEMGGVITIVSGLPRSGTSMMMRMLEAGGMAVVVDNIRKSDEDNPKGYYEFERVKNIKFDTSWLDSTQGMVFKMVSMLLYYLPSDRRYKIIFMRRNIDELLASQRVILGRQDKETSKTEDEKMARLFTIHLAEMEKWLNEQKNMDVLYVNYNELIKNPRENIQMINTFLDNSLYFEKMIDVVDKSLYRQRR